MAIHSSTCFPESETTIHTIETTQNTDMGKERSCMGPLFPTTWRGTVTSQQYKCTILEEWESPRWPAHMSTATAIWY